MKKILILSIIIFLFSCSHQDYKKSFIEGYIETLIEKYPNFASNDIAKKAINDSIRNHIALYMNKEAKDLDGIEFKFDRLIDGKNGYCAVFKSDIYTSIDNPSKNGDKYIGATINIIAFGNIDKETASKLDSEKSYFLSGVLHNWDEDNNIDILSSSSYKDINLGTYILDNMLITERQKQ